MEIDWKKVDELTLALMHLTTFDDSCDEGEVRRPQRGGREALARAVREVLRRFAALVTRAGAAATAPSSSIPKISARCSFPIAPHTLGWADFLGNRQYITASN